jgi:hypothetical protein
MGIWRSIFGWRALFRWDALGAVVPGIFLAAGLGMLGIDWFPYHLLIAQWCFAVAGFLCLVKIVGHAVEWDDTPKSRWVFGLLLGTVCIGGTIWIVYEIQLHKDLVALNIPTPPLKPPPPSPQEPSQPPVQIAAPSTPVPATADNLRPYTVAGVNKIFHRIGDPYQAAHPNASPEELRTVINKELARQGYKFRVKTIPPFAHNPQGIRLEFSGVTLENTNRDNDSTGISVGSGSSVTVKNGGVLGFKHGIKTKNNSPVNLDSALVTAPQPQPQPAINIAPGGFAISGGTVTNPTVNNPPIDPLKPVVTYFWNGGSRSVTPGSIKGENGVYGTYANFVELEKNSNWNGLLEAATEAKKITPTWFTSDFYMGEAHLSLCQKDAAVNALGKFLAETKGNFDYREGKPKAEQNMQYLNSPEFSQDCLKRP